MRKIFMALGLILLPNVANAACLKVQDDSKIILSDETLAPLKAINYGRKELFDALYRTSSVSYTHLDVYKRQSKCSFNKSGTLLFT